MRRDRRERCIKMKTMKVRSGVSNLFGRMMTIAACLATASGTAAAAIDLANSGSASSAAVPAPCDDRRAERNAALEADAKLPFDPRSILVMFEEGADEQAVIKAVGGEVIQRFELVPGLVHVSTSLPVEQAIELAVKIGAGGVRYAEPDFVVKTAATPNDARFGQLWGMRNNGQTVNGDSGTPGIDIRAERAWDFSTGSPSIVIAGIDSGVRGTHRDLAPNMWRNAAEIAGNGIDDDRNGRIDDVAGWNFYDGNNNPADLDGHGTHTAGTFGAKGNDGVGVAGVAWACRIMPLKFLGSFGGFTTDAIASLDYAVRMGAKLSNNSWGGGAYSQSLADSIDRAGRAGHLFVAAAGNSGVNSDVSPMYPAAYPLDNIISVAAIDNDGRLAGFSNYGRASVDIAAPGVSILSCVSAGDQAYDYYDGTSMAAPHVTGAAALVWCVNPSMTAAQVRSRLLSSARLLASLAGKVGTGGMLDAAAAVGTPTTVTTRIVRGVADSFSRSNGTEAAAPRSSLSAAARSYFNLPLVPFDVFPGSGANANVIFADSFVSLPSGIRSATLRLRLRAGLGGSETDVIRLGFATSSAGSVIASFNTVSVGTAAGRTWSQGQTATITLNLGNLRTSSGSTVNLLTQLNSRRFLDVIVSDDSGVDHMELELVRDQ